ncbi:MAG: DUF3570 domain-containing protein [Pseudomonadales bacterium]|nr:DUF3570 domain-containing protein [Pseudomonadales bacterium]
MRQQKINGNLLVVCLLLVATLLASVAHATVLPEERADVMYHEYDGDGITISGPSVLVRKNFLDKVSVSANYYVDNVTSASIDVRSYGSPYTEERTETSIGVDYLNEKSVLSLSYTQSSENDYEANTYFFGISQDFFGDLTNIAVGFGIGDDEISETGDVTTDEKLDRQNFRLSISQILTKKLILGINVETVSEEGYLQNPYRKSSIIRFGHDSDLQPFEDESYPQTRTSDAISIRLKYHLPYRAAVKTEFRYYSDSWDISARNFELGYIHPLEQYPLTFELKYRYYTQGDAFFYYDLIDAIDENTEVPTFHGRDKELSQYDSVTYGVGAKWEFLPNGWSFIENASVSLYYDYLEFNFDNFSDATKSTIEISNDGDKVSSRIVGPKFEFDATVIRLFFTAVY